MTSSLSLEALAGDRHLVNRASRALRLAARLGALLVALLAARPGSSETPSPLSSAIPSNVLLYARWDGGGEHGFASRFLQPFFRECSRSGFVDAWLREARASVGAEDRDTFDLKSAHWRELFAEFDVRTLLSRELVVAARVGVSGRLELLLLVRVGDARDRLLATLRKALYGVAGEGENLEIEVGDRDGAATTLLYSRVDPGEQIAVSGRDGVIGIASSMQLLRQSFRLLDHRGSDTGFVASDTYLEAQRKLSDASIATMHPRDGAGARIGEFEFYLAPGVVFSQVPELDVLETYHLVSRIHERAILTRTRSRLRDGDHAFTAAVAAQPSVRDLLPLVPDGARGFSASAGFSPAPLWESGVESAARLFGERFLRDELEESLAAAGFDAGVLRAFTGRRLLVETSAGAICYLEFRPSNLDGAEGEEARAGRQKLIQLLESAHERFEGWPVELRRPDPSAMSWELKIPLLEAAWTLTVGDRALRVADFLGAVPELLPGEDTADSPEGLRLPGGLEPPEGLIEQIASRAGGNRLDALRWLARAAGIVGTLLPDGESSAWKPLLVSLPALDRSLGSLEIFGASTSAVVRDGVEYHGSSRVELAAPARF